MENPIAVICAMEEEINTLVQRMSPVHKERVSLDSLPIFAGDLAGRKVVLARCGIGKVNAALATQYLIDRFRPRAIINSGVAGGLSSAVAIGDLVIADESMQHDVDVTHLDYAQGVIPRLKTSVFQADRELSLQAVQAAQNEVGCNRVHQGMIVSGDQFVSSVEQKQHILAHFPTAICVEMEGAAIAQTAYLNQVPYVIVRAISDQADNTAPADFDAYLLQIIPALNAVIEEFIRSVPLHAK